MERVIDSAYSERAWLIVYLHREDVAVSIQHRRGRFSPGETLDFSPSGSIAICQKSAWSRLLGTLHFLPQSGSAAPGDEVRGRTSGANARIERVIFDDFAAIAELLRYIRSTYPDMRIVTVDQALDLLGFL